MAGYVYRPTYTDKATGEKKESSVWWCGYSVNGKKYRESTKTTKKREAEDFLARRLADRGQAPAQQVAERTTFADLCDLIREDYRRNGRKSESRLERSIGHLEGFFDGYTVPAITEAAVERYVTERLKAGYAPASVNRELAALKRMLRLGYKLRLVPRVPDISTLREDNARKGFFSEADLCAILATLHAELHPLVKAAYITGWRKSELLSRDWRHVDFEAGWIRLEPGETKNGEGRMFPLTDRLRGVLEAQQVVRLEVGRRTGRMVEAVFFRHDGAYVGERIRNFHKAWSAGLEAAELESRIFHDFRRTAVRNLVRAGVPEKVAMELTGHKTRSVFDRYNIVDEGMLKGAGEQLDRLHARG